MSLEISRIKDRIVFSFDSFKLYVILNFIECFLYFILKIVWVDSEAIQKKSFDISIRLENWIVLKVFEFESFNLKVHFCWIQLRKRIRHKESYLETPKWPENFHFIFIEKVKLLIQLDLIFKWSFEKIFIHLKL